MFSTISSSSSKLKNNFNRNEHLLYVRALGDAKNELLHWMEKETLFAVCGIQAHVSLLRSLIFHTVNLIRIKTDEVFRTIYVVLSSCR